jgi:hypothetical protein
LALVAACRPTLLMWEHSGVGRLCPGVDGQRRLLKLKPDLLDDYEIRGVSE